MEFRGFCVKCLLFRVQEIGVQSLGFNAWGFRFRVCNRGKVERESLAARLGLNSSFRASQLQFPK
jgi:hypothetical protein